MPAQDKTSGHDKFPLETAARNDRQTREDLGRAERSVSESATRLARTEREAVARAGRLLNDAAERTKRQEADQALLESWRKSDAPH